LGTADTRCLIGHSVSYDYPSCQQTLSSSSDLQDNPRDTTRPETSMPPMEKKTVTRSSDTHAFWRLKRLREVKGVTLEDLAQQTGLTKSFLSKVERGISMPSIATVLKIADAFKVSAGSLFSSTESKDDLMVVRKNERKPFTGRRFKAGNR